MSQERVASLTKRERILYALLSVPCHAYLPRKAEKIRQRARWSAERMEEFRLRRCREVLVQAAARTPYYRELFRKHGFDARAFRSFEDLRDVPVLTRAKLRESFASLHSESYRASDLIQVQTGGTTGDPVKVLLDKKSAVERLLVTHRLYAFMGRTLGSPTLLIAGSPIDFHAWTSMRDSVKNRLMKTTVHSSFDLTSVKLESLLDEVASGRYRFVIAYSSVFDLLAGAVERSGATVPFPRIIATAEMITDAQRERWSRILDAEVFELYGSREMNSLAGETEEHDGLVVNTDIYHMEITNERGQPLPYGSPGIITVTSLLEHGMPLIRYQLGDAGVMTEGPPGARFPSPRLRITHGRVLDVIECPDGKALPGEFFPHLIKEVSEDVQRFQVVQVDTDRLVVRVVPTPSYRSETTAYLREKIEQRVGTGMRVDFEFVDDIAPAASGKFQPTINLVAPNERRVEWG